jgi:hypothetical protein
MPTGSTQAAVWWRIRTGAERSGPCSMMRSKRNNPGSEHAASPAENEVAQTGVSFRTQSDRFRRQSEMFSRMHGHARNAA